MPIVIGSAHWSEPEFLSAFEDCSLPLSCFRHGDHLRFAWIHLQAKSVEQAIIAVRHGIKNYAARHRVAHLFHETITVAWVKLLSTHEEGSFEEFIQVHEHRLTRELLYQFWTFSLLDSDAARVSWLPPDKKPLP